MRYLVIALFGLLFFGCSNSRPRTEGEITLPAVSFEPLGRTAIRPDKLELVSSASSIGFSFSGERCSVWVSLDPWQDHNYLQYELDGVYGGRIRIGKGEPNPIQITATTKGDHKLLIYKATEAHSGPIYIHKLTARSLKSIPIARAPLIEFIGNSITCGAASDLSGVSCGAGEYLDQHNALQAYGPRVAKTLDVNFLISGVSGFGIYRNWNSDGPALPEVYDKLDFDHEATWNFATYHPALVSIALGTNDLSDGDGKKMRLPFDSARFVNACIEFVKHVRSKYENVPIVLLSSPMIKGNKRVLLHHCLDAVKEKVDILFPGAWPVWVRFVSPLQGKGCSGHPSVEEQGVMANELTPFFKDVMIQIGALKNK